MAFSSGQGKIVLFKRAQLHVAQWQWQKHLAIILLLTWGLFIVYGTMLPFDFSASGDLIQWRLHRLWERPLRGLGGSWADVYSNIAFFMPWGFLLAIWRVGRGSNWWATLVLALLSAACLSGSVEIVQIFAPGRSTSVVDLVTNTFGSIVGAAIGWPLARWVWPVASVRIRQLLLSRPVAACALTVAMGLLLAGLSPSYNKLGANGVAASLKMARLIPFGPSSGGPTRAAKACLWGAELLAWMLTGGLFVLAARESGQRGVRAIASIVALVTGLSLAIEAMQVVIPGRDVDMSSVLLALSGSALGAALVTRLAAVDARRWIEPALLIWGVATMLAAWNPPRFTWPDRPFLRPEMIVPYWSYFDSRTLEDVADVVGQAVYFLPLGAMLAARSWRQSFLSAVMIGFSVAVVLEFGQAFLPARTADVSDAISAAAGTGLGLALWRWGESARTSSMGVTRYRVVHRASRRD
jgi:VanZ family protein